MSVWTLALLLQVTAGTTPDSPSYAQAYRQSQESGQPLVVLVGADWCPACVSMKYSTLTDMRRAGQMDGVIYTIVDKDTDPELAGKLMQGTTIPQLIVFARTPEGWRRHQLTGPQSSERVGDLLTRAIDSSRVAPTVLLKPAIQ